MPVSCKRICEHTVSILPPNCDEAILVIGYRGGAIKDRFGRSFGRIKLTYVEQAEPLGTGDALRRAQPFLKQEPFLVLYADDLYHPQDLIDCAGGGCSVLVKESRTPERFGVCLVDGSDRLLGILEKRPNPPTNLVNVGVYFLNHKIFDVPPIFLSNGEHNLAEQIGVLAETETIYVTRARFWCPIGYPEDVPKADEWLLVDPEARVN